MGEKHQETEISENEDSFVEAVEQTVEDITEAEHVDELSELQSEKDNLTDRLLRLQAEFENYKRRTEKERILERKYKAQDIAGDLLPVLDNFDRALQSDTTEVNQGFLEGVKMVYNQLSEALTSAGIEKINTENQAFDPNLHHAVMQVEDETLEPNTVVEELQSGYILKDRVIRPAMVKVNK